MENTLSKALRVLGSESSVFNQLLVNMTGTKSELWIAEFRKFTRGEPCWTEGQVTQVAELKPTPSILQLVSTIVVNATTSKLVAKERFVINTKHNAPVRISHLGDNFKVWFLNGDGKTEDSISEQTLRYAKLRKLSVDGHIVEELGGEAKVETTLSEMFSLMEKQKHGEDGVLLNNGWANLFYIKDSAGVLRAVHVAWGGVGWFVSADSVGDSNGWRFGRQVFSRLSS